MSRKELALQSGVSDRTITNIESGRVPSRRPQTLEPVAAVLGWAPGSIDAVLEGGSPMERAPQAPEANVLIETLPLVYEFGRTCVALGGSQEARDAFEDAVRRLVGSVPKKGGGGGPSYGLAAYRPHALGEGVPPDDAERIWQRLHDQDRTPLSSL
jgi:transcriptional regulator with XRE-family HTH domain